MPIISRVSSGDLDHLVESVTALFAEDGGRRDPHMDVSWPDRHGPRYYRSLAEDPSSLCLLAWSEGVTATVVGHLIGKLNGQAELRPHARMATLESMRVDRTHRRSGIGGALLEEFLSWARADGRNEVVVTAYTSNAEAMRFYQNCGFQPFESRLHLPLP